MWNTNYDNIFEHVSYYKWTYTNFQQYNETASNTNHFQQYLQHMVIKYLVPNEYSELKCVDPHSWQTGIVVITALQPSRHEMVWMYSDVSDQL